MFLLECCRTITKTALLEKIKILYNYIMTTLATRRGYRGKSKRSLCRKKTVRKCRKVKGCKNIKKTAKKSRYCRKRHNKRLRMKGGNDDDLVKECFEECTGKIRRETGRPFLSSKQIESCNSDCLPGGEKFNALLLKRNPE